MINNLVHLFVGLERTLEEIEWTIISVIDEVLKIIFDGDSEFVAIIIFTNFEFSIFKFAVKIFEIPPFLSLPISSTAYILHILTINNNG